MMSLFKKEQESLPRLAQRLDGTDAKRIHLYAASPGIVATIVAVAAMLLGLWHSPASFELGWHWHSPLPSSWQSSIELLGWPLVVLGDDARGWVSIGQQPTGLVAVGAQPTGVVALGAMPIGVVPVGPVALGLLPLGAAAVGLVSYGPVSVGWIAVGQVSLGWYAHGGVATGAYAWGGQRAYGVYHASNFRFQARPPPPPVAKLLFAKRHEAMGHGGREQ